MRWKNGKVRNIYVTWTSSLSDCIPPGRAVRCKEKYRDYRAKVKRSIANNQLDALETPARGLSSSTPHRKGSNESNEERGRAERDLERGLGYWESLQNSVRLKRSAIRPQTVSAADVYVSWTVLCNHSIHSVTSQYQRACIGRNVCPSQIRAPPAPVSYYRVRERT